MARRAASKSADAKKAADATKSVEKAAATTAAEAAGALSADAPASSAIRARDRLQAKLDRKRAQLREARARLRDLEALLDDAGGVSPFAPERFPELPPIGGVTLAAAEAGVKYAGRLDLMLAKAEGPALAVAGVLTRSGTRAAPVLWCADRLAAFAGGAGRKPLALVVNAGNANAFTGAAGASATETMAAAAAKAAGISADRMFVASTGVIGEPLPTDAIAGALGGLGEALDPGAWEPAAKAIMTTDTYAKGASAEIEIAGQKVRISGIAKGSGMIAPDMATMLSFIFTDAHVEPDLLQKIFTELTETTFNAITVDSDTSTSDTALLFATGAAKHPRIESARSDGYTAFRRALERVMRGLSHAIVKDGEGCSKFVEVRVEGAKTRRSARAIGRAIANSPLVKTAWAGEDANWGRIVMAVGKAGEPADRDKLTIRYGPHRVAENGVRVDGYDEAALSDYMKNAELVVSVDVGVGAAAASVWTCDLTHGYVSINADYRS